MNRDEFEKAYADKYTAGDLSAVVDNRDGEGYTDHHIDLCWKVQQCKNKTGIVDRSKSISELEW